MAYSPTTNQNSPLLLIFQYEDEKVWVKIEFPYRYEQFVEKAAEVFTNLNGAEFIFSDETDVRLDSNFLTEYVLSQTKGYSLKNYLENIESGREILNDYVTNKVMSDKSRKKLVTLVVEHLLEYKKIVGWPILSSEKCKYAEIIIELFPNLKNPFSECGYDHFYNPKTGTGYIASKLSNLGRRSNTKNVAPHTENQNDNSLVPVETVDESDIIRNAISFLKRAVSTQLVEIIQKTKETFKIRRFMYMNDRFFDEFPRFKDTPQLIDVEFQLLFPSIDQNIFIDLYPSVINDIITLYTTENGDYSLSEWDRMTNSLVALTQLIPPTARGPRAAGRGKKIDIIKKLIKFKKAGTPIQVADEEKSQPRIIAVGPNKQAVNQFYIEIDKTFILLPVNDMLRATDYLFKAQYAFNTEFDADLKNFWIFIQNYIYGISRYIVKPTTTNVTLNISEIPFTKAWNIHSLGTDFNKKSSLSSLYNS
ncbi:hypothetical protein PV328_011057 [Microctonus aethiopoides]|uniref:Uncharacterized protein n=1 Tax=Microctonus aethiopoides TaxID=144406 RepID=A0AA39C3Q8_9HYME|nr:hypothetical protein PV328_011057 [Microctonus aethiopoides]